MVLGGEIMSEELTDEQKKYLDSLVEEYGKEGAIQLIERMVAYTQGDKGKLAKLPIPRRLRDA